MDKRIYLKPNNNKIFLKKVIDYYSGNSILALEFADFINDFDIFSNNIIDIKVFKHEYSLNSKVIFIELLPDNSNEVYEKLSHDKHLYDNIGAIHIYKNNNLVFLAGDKFDNECLSFSDSNENKKIIKDIIENNIGVIIG